MKTIHFTSRKRNCRKGLVRISFGLALTALVLVSSTNYAQGTLLLRQPDISDPHIVFAYG